MNKQSFINSREGRDAMLLDDMKTNFFGDKTVQC